MNQFEEARKYLRSCGIDHPDPDVDLMAAFCAGRPLKNAIGSTPPTLNQPQELKFRRMVARRGEKRERDRAQFHRCPHGTTRRL